MRAILLSVVLLGALVAVAPPAAAEPCEVPGCQIVGPALCAAGQSKAVVANPKQAVSTLEPCTRAPA